MIGALISSKTKIRLLIKFFLNPEVKAYLRGLENEFNESTNGIRVELNKLEEVGMITSSLEGNKKYYAANTSHPLFKELNSIIRKHIGLDAILENIVKKLGDIEKVYLIGSFAKGIDNGIIDLEIVGAPNKAYLNKLIEKVELNIGRKIRYIIFSCGEHKLFKEQTTKVEIWNKKSEL